jgi:hypothetical protein
MSRQSSIHVDGSARTVARFGARPVDQPFVKASLDFLIVRRGVTPSEILAHHIEPGLEQLERRPERGGE